MALRTFPGSFRFDVSSHNSIQTGEIDIIEGINDVEPNQSTLHTSSGKLVYFLFYISSVTEP